MTKSATNLPKPNNPVENLITPTELNVGEPNAKYGFVGTFEREQFNGISNQLKQKRLRKKSCKLSPQGRVEHWGWNWNLNLGQKVVPNCHFWRNIN